MLLPLLRGAGARVVDDRPAGALDKIPVAIVNSDTIVTEPQPMAAGRALTASLTNPSSGDQQLDWTLTDTDDAT